LSYKHIVVFLLQIGYTCLSTIIYFNMNSFNYNLASDQQLFALLDKELVRQKSDLEMIPSENYVSQEVLAALGTVLTNKYSEGYPGKRYYGGCQTIDEIEDLARQRAQKLFCVDHANVQPYSGSTANLAVYGALLQPGDTIMGQDISFGGHLTHGAKVSFSSKWFKAVSYPTGADGWLDFDLILKIAKEHQPRLLIAGASAYPRIIDWQKFKIIANEVNAWLMVDMAHVAGLVAAGAHPNPCGIADIVTTTTHKTLRGPRGAMILCNGLASEPNKACDSIDKDHLPTIIDRAVFPGLQGGPHNHQTAAIAVALYEAAQPEFKQYGKQVITNCRVLVEELLAYGAKLVTNGSDNHLCLIDTVSSYGLSGKEAAERLAQAGIIVNKNIIPNDQRPPYSPSGIRLGTPAITTRGLKEEEMKIIANIIHNCFILESTRLDEQKVKVETLLNNFPIY
jgi:glycine hydroxymethyltransferase